ncbi:D-alanyl-D-alanine carboxypeptidase [Kribbella antiqua]|uniref:D-alanyl-D-alanine carboxypeptidase n=1 Tax=Kribbella antiqua TaxID=2512217 RepID=A0A4R2IK80_9ACTN|nr:serine hydrolase domain-containing protein [Kribbella antiqua]TCO45393.1 D-alanyl-D-alanine carboxypeptidase [Kribbella antiqua]
MKILSATLATLMFASGTNFPSAQLDQLVSDRAASAALLAVDDSEGRQSDAAGDAVPSGYFRIGSVTKTFVATVVLQLVDEGRLSLDDPIDRHLPGQVPNGENITVRQVLNHQSGIYDYAHDAGYSTNRWRGTERFRHFEPGELLAVAFSHPPYFSPGQGWHYSNTNYVIAGLLIERLTDHSYGAEIARRILLPLGLSQTSVPGDRPGLPRPHARGYAEVDGKLADATLMNPSLDWAAGEMISTTRDLNQFFDALLGGRLISPAALAEMRGYVPATSLFDYGLGLQRFHLPCGKTVEGHSGELLGYTTYSLHGSEIQATLSYNPLPSADPATTLISLFSTIYC